MLRNAILRMAIKRVIRTPTPRNIGIGYPILSTTPRTMSTSWNNHSFPIIHSQSHRYFATDNGDIRRGMKADMEKDMNDTSTKDENAKANKRYESDDLFHQLTLIKNYRDKNQLASILVEIRPYLKIPKGWNQVMGALIKVGDRKSAYETLEKMRQAGCKPDVISYNRLLTAFDRANNFDKFEMVVTELNGSDLKWDKHTFSTTIKFYANNNNLEKVEEIVQKMEKEGVLPNVYIYSTLMTAYDKVENIEKVEETFEDMIQGYKKWLLVRQMKHKDMNKEEKEIFKMKEEQVKPNVEIYGTRMHASRNNVKSVEEIWKEMKTYGIKPNDVLYNTRMNANIDDVERVEEIWKEMMQKGIKPTAHTYVTFSNAYSKVENIDRCKELVKEATAAGIDLNT